MDAFSKEFLAKHGDSIAEGDALHELRAIAAFGKTNTVRLDVLNGYLQRLHRAKANCVVAPDLRVLSAEFLLGTIRERERRSLCPATAKLPKSTRISKDRVISKYTHGKKEKRVCGGGAWRAFLSECGREGESLFKQSEAYAALPHCLRTRRRVWQKRANWRLLPIDLEVRPLAAHRGRNGEPSKQLRSTTSRTHCYRCNCSTCQRRFLGNTTQPRRA